MSAGIAETARSVDAAAVMELLAGRPRLLGLGEPAHGEDVLLRLRNELFRQLVERDGYRTIAIESDCLLGLVVDDHVTSGAGAIDDVMARGFSHGWGDFAGNRELVRWMREHNDGRPPNKQVRFAGVDGPLEITGAASPRRALTALHAYLAAMVDADLLPCGADTLDDLLGADERWSEPAAMRDPSRSVGRTQDAATLRLLAEDLVALLDGQTPHLIATSSREDWQRARLLGRTATGLLSYHHWMADTSPGRLARLVGLRDSMIAANLLALADHGPTLVSAHNGRLQRHRSAMSMGGRSLAWWSAGAIADAHLGGGYAFLATAVGTIRHRGVDDPPPDTVEGVLSAFQPRPCLIDPRAVPAAALVHRESPWRGYSPLDPANLADIDGIVFVPNV